MSTHAHGRHAHPSRLPVWTLSSSFDQVEYAYRTGRIDAEQWRMYRAVWRYSAVRFSTLVPDWECPRVREAWARIEQG